MNVSVFIFENYSLSDSTSLLDKKIKIFHIIRIREVQIILKPSKSYSND
jgi:hypothetical protein